jgi:MerR family transcriptional regulator, light-induced transcriptional regulator
MARCSGWRKEPMAEREASPGRGDDQVPRYRVAAVERMTRVPASTLRSWERRYGWPRPLRADSGQRLYSDHDVAVIRFLDRRRDEGMSMSQATGLLDSAPAVEDHDPGRLQQRLVAALRAFDEAEAERAFAAAEALLGAEGVAAGLVPAAIAAAAATPGPDRGRDGPPVEVEHFASNLLRRQVLRLLDGLPPALGRPVLVGCGPDEQHELGALLVTLLLRARGHRVVYLGARVPGPAMERATTALDPAGVVVSLTMADSLERALRWTRDSRRWARPDPAVWWGGPAVASDPGAAAGLPGRLLSAGVGDGAATVDASLARHG